MSPDAGALHNRCWLVILGQPWFLGSLGFSCREYLMKQSFAGLEQRRSLSSVNLRKRMAQVRKLRELIEAAEAARLGPGQSTMDRSVIAPPAGHDLRA